MIKRAVKKICRVSKEICRRTLLTIHSRAIREAHEKDEEVLVKKKRLHDISSLLIFRHECAINSEGYDRFAVLLGETDFTDAVLFPHYWQRNED